jgi:hypothetical protein
MQSKTKAGERGRLEIEGATLGMTEAEITRVLAEHGYQATRANRANAFTKVGSRRSSILVTYAPEAGVKRATQITHVYYELKSNEAATAHLFQEMEQTFGKADCGATGSRPNALCNWTRPHQERAEKLQWQLGVNGPLMRLTSTIRPRVPMRSSTSQASKAPPQTPSSAPPPGPGPAAMDGPRESGDLRGTDPPAHGRSARCSLADAAKPYMSGATALDCTVVGQRLRCCEVRTRQHARPEDNRSFDPLDPPRRLKDGEGLEVVDKKPVCGTSSLSLELHDDEAVGWKDLNSSPDHRRAVRLPLDGQCRLSTGTAEGFAVANHPKQILPLPMLFDPRRAGGDPTQPETQYELGKFWLVRNSTRYAITHFTAAARAGHADSQYELAKIFETGARGVRSNLSEADRLYALAAAQGVEQAKLSKQRRDIIKRNLQILLQQAQAGDPDKQYALALLYAFGKAVPMDWEKAVSWLKRAGDQDHPRALNDLGWMYSKGIGGVRRDEAAGRALLERSVALGCDWALVNLARITYRGEQDVATSASTRARDLLHRAQQSPDPVVVREASYWLSILDRDRSSVIQHNTMEARKAQIDAMQSALQQAADASAAALQDIMMDNAIRKR